MALSFPKLRADVEEDLEARIAMLNGEVASLRKALSKRGARAISDGRESAADLYDDLRDRVVDALPAVRRNARMMERAARDHPATTVAVGLVVLGLIALALRR